MKIKQSDSHKLVIADFPILIGVFGLIGPVCVAYGLAVEHNAMPLLAMCVFVLLAVVWVLLCGVFCKRSQFEFDLIRQQLVWNRWGLYGHKRGIVPFDQIQCASVQSSTGSSAEGGGLSYRVALSTTQGCLPLTDSYSQGEAKQCERIRSTINSVLQSNNASESENDILALAAHGQKLAAIVLARERYGYDLTQARQFVEELLK